MDGAASEHSAGWTIFVSIGFGVSGIDEYGEYLAPCRCLYASLDHGVNDVDGLCKGVDGGEGIVGGPDREMFASRFCKSANGGQET